MRTQLSEFVDMTIDIAVSAGSKLAQMTAGGTRSRAASRTVENAAAICSGSGTARRLSELEQMRPRERQTPPPPSEMRFAKLSDPPASLRGFACVKTEANPSSPPSTAKSRSTAATGPMHIYNRDYGGQDAAGATVYKPAVNSARHARHSCA